MRRLRTKGHAPTRPTCVSGGSRCKGVLMSHPDTVRPATAITALTNNNNSHRLRGPLHLSKPVGAGPCPPCTSHSPSTPYCPFSLERLYRQIPRPRVCVSVLLNVLKSTSVAFMYYPPVVDTVPVFVRSLWLFEEIINEPEAAQGLHCRR